MPTWRYTRTSQLGKLREGARLQVRAETINAFNHPKFGNPNTTFESPQFGQITSQLNQPRQVQLGMKLTSDEIMIYAARAGVNISRQPRP